MTRLTTCANCRRHVRATETRCPFCSTPRRARKAPAWVVAAGVGLSTLTYACTCYGATPCPPCEGPGCPPVEDPSWCRTGYDSSVVDGSADAGPDAGIDAGTDSAPPSDSGAGVDAGDGG